MESGYIHIANNIFPTLLAISWEEQAQGLMGQAWPPPVMSFIYINAQVNRFWMKNTPSPLDLIFCHQGEVKQICFGEPNSTTMLGDNQLSDLVVELPFGTSYSSGIKLGHQVGLVKPTHDELKKIIAEKYLGIIKI
jgi:uncharacterized membrane protein (UPF0127 family)